MTTAIPHTKRLLLAAITAASLSMPFTAVAAPASYVEVKSLSLTASSWDAKNAPPSKFIKKVTETKTTANLNLRSSPSTGSKSYGVMPNGTIVKLTGKTSGKWKQLKWGSKTGWASGEYLKTRTYTKDESVRYMNGYADIQETSAMNRRVGPVNFRTKVTLLDVKGTNSHIKTGYYHGWVPSSRLSIKRPAVQYRYVQSSGSVYTHWDPKKDAYAGRIHVGERYEYRRWVGSSKRDEIKVNGKWVWTSTTNRPVVKYQYRYAQKNGSVYSSANKSQSKKVGTISKGTKVRWGAWDKKNRRDEILLNGKWVWSDVTDRPNPNPKPAPKVVNVSDYGRFTTGKVTLRSQPSSSSKSAGTLSKGMKVTVTHKADGGWVKVKSGSKVGFLKEKDYLRIHGPYSVAVYGTLRTGQSAYGVMGNFQQKNMDQRIASSSLYQLWNRNWTFLTNGPKTVVTEQFQYSDSSGPKMLRKLDAYEGQLKYKGRPMYTRQKVRLSDGSQSWTYKTTSYSEKVVKNSGRYISSGDFLKRS